MLKECKTTEEFIRVVEHDMANAIITDGFKGMRNVLWTYLPAYVSWLDEIKKEELKR